MIACYHQDLHFEDPAFGQLSYIQACAMWKMLCESAKDLTVDFSIIRAGDQFVETRWIAEYCFGNAKRFVRNEIIAEMTIKDGKIIRHIDKFDLYKWAKQAMGWQGWLLGATPFFRKKDGILQFYYKIEPTKKRPLGLIL